MRIRDLGREGTVILSLVSLAALLLVYSTSDDRAFVGSSVYAQGTVEKRALLIAGGKFSGEKGDDFTNDVEHLKQVLLTDTYWKNNQNNIKVLDGNKVQLSKTLVKKAISDLFKNADDNDIALIYFTGHGGKIETEGETPQSDVARRDNVDEHLSMEPDKLVRSGNKLIPDPEFSIKDDDLNDLLKDIKGIKVLVVDACNCDGIVGSDDDFNLNKTIVLTGCGEVDFKDGGKRERRSCLGFKFGESGAFKAHEHSLFSVHLIAALGNFNFSDDPRVLADAAPTGDGNKMVTVKEWFDSVNSTDIFSGLGQIPRIYKFGVEPADVEIFTYEPTAEKKGFTFENTFFDKSTRKEKCYCEVSEFEIITGGIIEDFDVEPIALTVEPLATKCALGPAHVAFSNAETSQFPVSISFVAESSDLPFPGFEFPHVILHPGNVHSIITDEWKPGIFIFRISDGSSTREVSITKVAGLAVGGDTVNIIIDEQVNLEINKKLG
jgi:hypothetical protein